jgi:hypothetical protein
VANEGKIRHHEDEEQLNQSCLNLVTNAVVLGTSESHGTVPGVSAAGRLGFPPGTPDPLGLKAPGNRAPVVCSAYPSRLEGRGIDRGGAHRHRGDHRVGDRVDDRHGVEAGVGLLYLIKSVLTQLWCNPESVLSAQIFLLWRAHMVIERWPGCPPRARHTTPNDLAESLGLLCVRGARRVLTEEGQHQRPRCSGEQKTPVLAMAQAQTDLSKVAESVIV